MGSTLPVKRIGAAAAVDARETPLQRHPGRLSAFTASGKRQK